MTNNLWRIWNALKNHFIFILVEKRDFGGKSHLFTFFVISNHVFGQKKSCFSTGPSYKSLNQNILNQNKKYIFFPLYVNCSNILWTTLIVSHHKKCVPLKIANSPMNEIPNWATTATFFFFPVSHQMAQFLCVACIAGLIIPTHLVYCM